MKELEVTIRIRNNRVKERRLALGLTQKELAERIGLTQARYGTFETMRTSPIDKSTGEWMEAALMIAEFYKVDPTELFPDSVRRVEMPMAVKQVDLEELRLTTSQHAMRMLNPSATELDTRDRELREAVKDVLKTLTPREQKVLILRFGLDGKGYKDLTEVGKHAGEVTRERIRQIEARALRKLRQPSRSMRLKSFVDGE